MLIIKNNLPFTILHYLGLKLSKLQLIYNNMQQYTRQTNIILPAFAASIAFQFTAILAIYLLSIAIGVQIPLIYFIVLMPIIWLIIMLPISLGGIGLREVSFVALFVAVGVPEQTAIILSLLVLLQNLMLAVTGGIFYLSYK